MDYAPASLQHLSNVVIAGAVHVMGFAQVSAKMMVEVAQTGSGDELIFAQSRSCKSRFWSWTTEQWKHVWRAHAVNQSPCRTTFNVQAAVYDVDLYFSNGCVLNMVLHTAEG